MANFIAMMAHLGKGDYALNPDNVARLLNGLALWPERLSQSARDLIISRPV
jgi:hypothetical protein